MLQSQDTFFQLQQGLKWSRVIPQTSSASGKSKPSSFSSCCRCDRHFNCLIQITCHRRPETVQRHLLIICPPPVHTSVHPVGGSDCLLVPFAWPRFIFTFYLYPCLSFAPTFHTHVLLRWHSHTLPPVSISILTSLFISAPSSPCLCMWVYLCSLFFSLLSLSPPSVFDRLIIHCDSVLMWSKQCDSIGLQSSSLKDNYSSSYFYSFCQLR